MGVKLFLLDIDNTVFDFDGTQKKALRQTCEDFAIALDGIPERFVKANTKVWRMFEEGKISKDDALVLRFKMLFGEEIDAESIGDRYLYNLGSVKPDLIEGAMDLVDWIERHASLWFVTNGHSQVQRRKMAISDLSHLRHKVTISDDVGVGKPHPDIFRHAVRSAGGDSYNADEVVMIGDNLKADIEGAAALGFKTIWFDRSGSDLPYPGHRVSELSEIRDILSH